MHLTQVKVKTMSTPVVIGLMFQQLRPKQWTKNLLIFAALVFSRNIDDTSLLIKTVIGFILFSIISSCVYILNDFVDRESDKKHPTKKYRPMASGLLNPYVALGFGILLLIISSVIAFLLSIKFGVLLSFYFLMNVAYSFMLKHVVIIDVMIIASGFVLRAIGGGLIINVKLTPWFLVCTMLLSLFLAISKRRHEYVLAQQNDFSHRKVLNSYNLSLLDQMNTIVTTATIISYALFTFTSGRTLYLMWTIPYVIYGIFRYLYLLHLEGKGGSPDKLLFEDKPILFTVLLYAITVVVILSFFE